MYDTGDPARKLKRWEDFAPLFEISRGRWDLRMRRVALRRYIVIRVGISGVPGHLASAVARGVAAADDLELTSVYNPNRAGDEFEGLTITADPDELDCDVVFEATNPDVVLDNLRAWHQRGRHCVVGTSGFTSERLDELRSFWGNTLGCLVVPNFSVGAVLMMRFAELAAPHFSEVEIIERHHHDKPDAPSGTSIATAARIAAAGGVSADESREIVAGSRGGLVDGVRIHSLRVRATLSDQEVALAKGGELLSIRHTGTEYSSFVDGALLALRHVVGTTGVDVGLDGVLGI
jgi:4-hydroxy-tetrahydrodipicolinate reductase